MSAVTFDTLQFVKDLQAKGFKPEQAEGISDALKKIISVAEVATSRDLKELEVAMKSDVEKLRLEIKAEMNVLKWMTGFIMAGMTSIVLKSFF
ncbi:hypothetical protein AGMMS50256_36520 [Betaproteobacteria bacterium]|nr:hypothetical protein AGMMS50256_36520 [Betaproteobacteria bacterium]